MAEPLSLDHARLELKRIGGADSALKILKRACGGGGLRDAAVIAHSTALILASCAQDGAAAVEIGAAASWATVVTTVFAQDEAAGSSVDAATRALVQRLLADAITSVASVSEAASPLRSALMSAADTGRPPLAVLAAGLRQQLRALGEAPASPDAAPHMEGTTVAQWPASRPATRPGSGCEGPVQDVPALRAALTPGPPRSGAACSRVFAALGSLAATDALEPVAGKGTESPFARACLQEGAVDAALAAAQLNVATGQDGADHTEAASSADDGFRARVGDLEGAAFNCLADIALASQPAASHVLAWQGVHTLLSRYADVGRRPVPSTGATAAAAVARLVAALWATSLAEAADAFRGEAAAVLDAAGGCMASEDVALQDAGCALVANLVLQVADKEALRASAACRSFHQRMLQGSECLLPLAWLLDSRADAVQRRAAQCVPPPPSLPTAPCAGSPRIPSFRVFAHMRRKRDNDLMVSMVEQGGWAHMWLCPPPSFPVPHCAARPGTLWTGRCGPRHPRSGAGGDEESVPGSGRCSGRLWLHQGALASVLSTAGPPLTQRARGDRTSCAAPSSPFSFARWTWRGTTSGGPTSLSPSFTCVARVPAVPHCRPQCDNAGWHRPSRAGRPAGVVVEPGRVPRVCRLRVSQFGAVRRRWHGHGRRGGGPRGSCPMLPRPPPPGSLAGAPRYAEGPATAAASASPEGAPAPLP